MSLSTQLWQAGPQGSSGSGWFIPRQRVPSPVWSSDWDKTRDTGVDRGRGVGWLDDEGWLGLEVLRGGDRKAHLALN